jgi:hypothetical protein
MTVLTTWNTENVITYKLRPACKAVTINIDDKMAKCKLTFLFDRGREISSPADESFGRIQHEL